MIRRWIERWIGHDRLEQAYEVRCAELYEARRLAQSRGDKLRVAEERLDKLRTKHQATLESMRFANLRIERQRRQLNDLTTQHIRTLTELNWTLFLLEQNEAVAESCGKLIRLMDHDQAWEVADLLAVRFGYPMYAHSCAVCPVNPVTRDYFWHVTRRYNTRRRA